MNSGDQSFLVRLDVGLRAVVNLDEGLAFEESRAAGVTQSEWTRQAHMQMWTMAPEEWELARPVAWTPNDGVSLERYRQLVMAIADGREPIDIDAHRVYLSVIDDRPGCSIGENVDEMLMVHPHPRRWVWNFGPEGSFGGEFGGGYWLDCRREYFTDARVPYDDAGIDAIAADVARQILNG